MAQTSLVTGQTSLSALRGGTSDLKFLSMSINADAPIGAIAGYLASRSQGATYTLLIDAGGRFVLVGHEVRTAAAVVAGQYEISVRSTDAHGWSKTFALTVPVFEGAARTGDIVFGPQADTGSVVSNLFTPAAAQKALCGSTYLPDLAAGWRMMFWNFSCTGTGAVPVERKPGNTNEIKWLSVLSGIAGARIAGGDAAFADFGGGSGLMADGGFAITDALPAVSSGAYARWLLETPAGGKRANGYSLNYNFRGQNADCGTLASQFDGVRAGGALGNPGDGSVFNGEATQAAGILVPKSAGYRSFMMIGTSIMRNQDGETRWLLSADAVRNAYGYLPIALDSATHTRMGWAQFAVNGANIANQVQVADGSLSFELRYKVLKAIAAKNGGRWPFTDVIVDFRNDAVAAVGGDAASTADDMKAKIVNGLAAIKAMFPGLPVHTVTLPPIQPVAAAAPWYYCSLSSQVPPVGNFKAAAVVIVNQWLRDTYAALGFASVCDIAADVVTVDDSIAKWPLSPFTAAGGGVIDAADYPAGLAAGVNLSTVGVTVNCPNGVAPEVGNILCLDPGIADRVEFFNNAVIQSVALVSGTKYLVKISAGSTVRAHPAGSIVMVSTTKDQTHPSKWLQDKAGLGAALAWKGGL